MWQQQSQMDYSPRLPLTTAERSFTSYPDTDNNAASTRSSATYPDTDNNAASTRSSATYPDTDDNAARSTTCYNVITRRSAAAQTELKKRKGKR
jgi:hypothetical protein